MAKQAKLVITINGKEVENTLRGVGAEIGRLRSDLRKLNTEDPEFKTKAAELQKAQKHYAEINREIRGMPKLMKAATDSFEAQRRKVAELRKTLENTSRSSADYKRRVTEYRSEMKKLDKLTTQMTGKPSYWERLAGNARQFTTLAAGIFTLGALTSKFRQLINLSAELSDKQSDVQKTTGMTKKEVRELTHELDKLNTRTSRIELLEIAVEGGRIGIAKDEIADFTAAMDKANVALGDVFGSASNVASVLGKLRFLYKETAEMGVSEAYNAIGSVLNELGANGVANEQNIAAFATRVGALPDAFKPSIADALALGAAFEESGVEANIAGRSYSILIQTAATKTEEFAKVMGITKEEVTELINSNPTEFFLRFTNSFKGMETNGTKMANTLKELGVNAMGVNMIIGAASSNNDRFRETIELSNKSLEEGVSMTNEFNVKNENLAATIEKIQKTFIEWIDSDRVQNFIEGLVNWFGGLIGAIDNSDKKTSTFIKTLDFSVKALAVFIASFVSWTAAMRLSALWSSVNVKNTQLFTLTTKGATMAQTLNTIAVSAAGVVYNRLTGNIYAARRAQIALNSAWASNPVGLILTGLTALISAIMIFRSRTKEAADQQREFGESVREAHKAAAEETGKSIAAVKSLINVIKDETASIENRKKAYQELIKIAPEFNGLLQDEIFNIEELTRVYEGYVTQLTKVAQAKATKQIHEDAQSEAVKGRAELFQVERELADAKAELSGITQYEETQKLHDGVWETVEEETRAYKEQSKAIAKLEKEREKLLDRQKHLDKRAESSTEFLDAERQRIQAQIDLQQGIIDSYEKEGEAFEGFVTEARKQLKYLNAEMAALGMPSLNDSPDLPNGNDEDNGGDKEGQKELDRRQKIADDLLKIEIRHNRQIRDERLKTREEAAELMENGFRKEAELLAIDTEKRLNKLRDELEDMEILRQEYRKRALEEQKKGNKEGAAGYLAQANELQKIIEEKNKTFEYIEQTHQLQLQKLKIENYEKQNDEAQKAHQRELRNLETKHNNELKAVLDLEAAKQLLRDEYGYSDDELNKIRDFEKAKSKIILEQQRQTYDTQVEFIQDKIEELQTALELDDALENTTIGRILSPEAREEMLEDLEEFQNIISKINEPEEEEDGDDEMRKKSLSFIDLFGFSGDQWDEAFNNLETLSGKLAFAQMAVQALSNAFSQYYDLQRQNMQRDLDAFTAATSKKRKELDKQLEEGYISQEFYNAQVEKLEAEVEQRRAEMEYQSAMNQWKMSLMQAAANTALGITSALSTGPKGILLAKIIGAMGALQIGMIASNKPKKPEGYFFGGESRGSGHRDEYGRELADGPLHANEYVIPEWLRRDPDVARMEEFIEARRRGNPQINLREYSPGYADGGVTRPAFSENKPTPNIPEEFIAVLLKLDQTLEKLREKPIEARLTRTMEVAKTISEDLEDYNNHRFKNKR